MIKTMVFIDSRVNDIDLLVSQFNSGTEYYILDANHDGVLQIEGILAGKSDYSSIQIISHGSAAAITIGSTLLSSNNLTDYQSHLETIGHSLNEAGDLLLYGCSVGAGDSGHQFIDTLSHLTNADVAASDNLTGSTISGGNWCLEASTGTIESKIPFVQDTPPHYNHTLLFTEVSPGDGGGGTPIFLDDFSSNINTTGRIAFSSSNTGFLGTATGNINTVGDTDWFRVSLEGGKTYHFDLVPSGLISVTYPSLGGFHDYCGDYVPGITMFTNWGKNSFCDFTATYTGDYFIEARSYDFESWSSLGVGSYKITVSLTPVTPPVTSVSDNEKGYEAAIDGLEQTSGWMDPGKTIWREKEYWTGIVKNTNGDWVEAKGDEDIFGSYCNNCTSYVAWRVGNGFKSLGNAKEWNDSAKASGHYDVSTTPKVGAIAGRENGTWGHVAYVEKVSVDNEGKTLIDVSEYNYDMDGKYGERKDLSPTSFSWFIDPDKSGNGDATDGYLAHALVWVDTNDNGLRDWTDANDNGIWDIGEGESWTLTDGNGHFTGLIGFGTLRVTANPSGGTIDISTGKAFTGSYSAPSGSTIINPLTTLIEAAGGNANTVKTALGLDASIDLTTFDPLAALSKGGPADLEAHAIKEQSAATQLDNLLDIVIGVTKAAGVSANSVSDTSAALANALIAGNPSGTINLADSTVLKNAIISTAQHMVTDAAALAVITNHAGAIADALALVNLKIEDVSDAASASALSGQVIDVADALTRIVSAQIVAQEILSAQAGKVVHDNSNDPLTITSGNIVNLMDKASSEVGQLFVPIPGENQTNHSPTGTVTITGASRESTILSASNTLADVDGLGTISYIWQADGVTITNGTDNHYTLTASEVGKVINVIASYTDLLGNLEYISSEPTTLVASINNAPTGSVTITGMPTEGQTLTVSNTIEDSDGLGDISYQWKAEGVAISGATQSIFVLSDAQVASTITVTASYTDGLGNIESMSSQRTLAVAPFSTYTTKVIYGTSNDDFFHTGIGNEAINGEAGIDTLTFSGNQSNYIINPSGVGFYVRDKIGTDGTDSIINIEKLQFIDRTLTIATTPDETLLESYRIYKAAFDRAPDYDGLGFWYHSMNAGESLTKVAEGFINSNEFRAMYGDNPTDLTFVTLLYQHVLGRIPDMGGCDFWMNDLKVETRAQVLAHFSESAENIANLVGVIANGIMYEAYDG